MDKVRRILGVIIIIALLLSSSVPFTTHIATADEGEGGMESKAEPIEEVVPEEDSSGELSVKQVGMVRQKGLLLYLKTVLDFPLLLKINIASHNTR
jgi:hypothetical protein